MVRNIIFFILLAIFGVLLILVVGASRQPTTSSEKPSTDILTQLFSLSNNKSTNSTINISGNEIEQLNLQKDLEEEIQALGLTDHVSLYYSNINGGYNVNINADRSWIPASMVKAFVVVEAFRQRNLRIINFDSRVTIKEDNVVPTELELSDYQPLRAGVKATIRELIEAMVTQSDNTAYNTLLDVLDRRNITTTLRSLGLTNTVVGEKLSLSDDQYAIDTQVPGRQPNKTTAEDVGHLFNLLEAGKVIENFDEILAIFKNQKLKTMIPAMLPEGVVIAHKTGQWPPYYHDGGIVYKVGDPFVLVIFTDSNDPTIVAKLAKISYYKTRDVVLGAHTSSFPAIILEALNKVREIFESMRKHIR